MSMRTMAVLLLSLLMAGVSGVGQRGAGMMFEANDATVTQSAPVAGGWTQLTAVNVMLLCLIHNQRSARVSRAALGAGLPTPP